MIGIYFSGTGNTKYCIEKFLSFFETTIPAISIENKSALEEIKKHKKIVFAYPVYFSNLPKIVHDFITMYGEVFREKDIFIISTMGLFSGDGAGCSARLLKHYGANIIGGLHLKMPDCISDEKLLKRSLQKNKLLIKNANRKIEESCNMLKNGTPTHEGLNILYHITGLLGQRLWFYNKTQSYCDKLKITVSKCVGCSKCVSYCTMHNLSIVNNKAVSKGRCTMCYRCINICPQQAVTLLGKKVIEQGTIEKYL